MKLARFILSVFFVLVIMAPLGCRSSFPISSNDVSEGSVGHRTVRVYFTDADRFANAIEPYEVPVERSVPPDANFPEAVLKEFFKGPTPEERMRGLRAEISGCTGFSKLRIQNGIAHVYLTGPCTSGGSTYTIVQPIRRNLLQFDAIDYIKIYHHGETEEPEGRHHSIPVTLEP